MLRAYLASLILCSVPALTWAQQEVPAPPAEPAATGTLDLMLDTGREAPEPRSTAKPAQKKTAVPSRGGSNRWANLPLPSRATVGRTSVRVPSAPAPSVLARLGLVTTGRIAIRAERNANSRLLSEVAKDTNLAVVAEGGQYYGVLMANNTLGWVPKSAIELLDYQTEVATPAGTAAPRTLQAGAAQTVGGTVARTADEYLDSLSGDADERTIALLRESFSYLGVPYVWAGNTRSGLDCSAFVRNVFATQGIALPRVSGDQAKCGIAVSGTDLRAGDRLYFDMKRAGRVSHTGIYLGNGYFIHASSNQGKVGVDTLNSHYVRALVAARRDQ